MDYTDAERALMRTGVYRNTAWCIWHEGICPWNDRSPYSHINLGDFRDLCVGVQGGSSAARRRARRQIEQATDGKLVEIILLASKHVPDRFQLRRHLKWVMVHEGERVRFYRKVTRGDFYFVRHMYHALQNGPDNVNLLAAISNGELKRVVVSIYG